MRNDFKDIHQQHFQVFFDLPLLANPDTLLCALTNSAY